MQPLPPPVPGPLALLDTTEGFARRKKISLWFVGSLLLVSTLILTIGLAATTRTENVTVGGYYPGIILVAAIVFLSFGVVAAFCCAIVDSVFAARHIEPRPLSAGRCQFYSSGAGYLYDVYQTEVTCYSLNGRCQLKVRSNTCYCCDLYACGSTEPSPAYYEFVGVRSCQDVVHLYRLLWVSTVLNVLGLCLGIVTAAVLGAFKDMVPLSQLAYGPSPPPQILYNPAQQILAYTGLCPPSMGVPTCSSYPLPLQGSLVLQTQRGHCIAVSPHPFSLYLSFLWLPRDEAGAGTAELLGSFRLWRRAATVGHCNVGERVWFLSVTSPGGASGASQKGTGPSSAGATGTP
ncbi:transmembrane protein 255B isoform X2 [Mus musculus]|uniref:transmembrane protein 255B isoform X2 n=1 Tax=Mus musculus TaxID=10090 RepID=UPI0003D7422B|nr:transmembrane protein 255B isoform X2 [Mus musculus]|eukprot:XP_006508874.1 PREDICTED: transmembrane protein 255B isoform X2 [Mus musculus]